MHSRPRPSSRRARPRTRSRAESGCGEPRRRRSGATVEGALRASSSRRARPTQSAAGAPRRRCLASDTRTPWRCRRRRSRRPPQPWPSCRGPERVRTEERRAAHEPPETATGGVVGGAAARRSRRRLGRRVGSLGDCDERWCGCDDVPSSPAVRREPERRNRSPWMRRACRERGERRAEREAARGDQRGCSANAVDCCIASSDCAAELGGTRRHAPHGREQE